MRLSRKEYQMIEGRLKSDDWANKDEAWHMARAVKASSLVLKVR